MEEGGRSVAEHTAQMHVLKTVFLKNKSASSFLQKIKMTKLILQKREKKEEKRWEAMGVVVITPG